MANLLVYSKTLSRTSSASILCNAVRERGHVVVRATPRRRPSAEEMLEVHDTESGRVDVALSYGVSATPNNYVLRDYARLETVWLTSLRAVGWNAHKTQMFRRLTSRGIPHVPWTDSLYTARNWLDNGETVLARRLLQSHSGNGITLVNREYRPEVGRLDNNLPRCNLYTKAWPDNNTPWGRVREYRVYISGEHAVGLTEKRRYSRQRLFDAGIDRDCPYNRLVRTNGNGWVFAHNDMRCSREQATTIMMLGELTAHAMSLGVGAVDIIVTYDRDYENLLDMRVIETNSSINLRDAPTTTNLIVDGIINFLDEWDAPVDEYEEEGGEYEGE